MDDSSLSDGDGSSVMPTVASVLGVKGLLRLRPHGSSQKAHVVLRRVEVSDDSSEDGETRPMVYFSLFAQKRIEVKPGKEILMAVSSQDGTLKDQALIFEGDLFGSEEIMEDEVDVGAFVEEHVSDISPVRQAIPPKLRRAWTKRFEEVSPTPNNALVATSAYRSFGVQAQPHLISEAVQAQTTYSSASVQARSACISTAVQIDRPPCLDLSFTRTRLPTNTVSNRLTSDVAVESTSSSGDIKPLNALSEDIDHARESEHSLSPMELDSLSSTRSQTPSLSPMHVPPASAHTWTPSCSRESSIASSSEGRFLKRKKHTLPKLEERPAPDVYSSSVLPPPLFSLPATSVNRTAIHTTNTKPASTLMYLPAADSIQRNLEVSPASRSQNLTNCQISTTDANLKVPAEITRTTPTTQWSTFPMQYNQVASSGSTSEFLAGDQNPPTTRGRKIPLCESESDTSRPRSPVTYDTLQSRRPAFPPNAIASGSKSKILPPAWKSTGPANGRSSQKIPASSAVSKQRRQPTLPQQSLSSGKVSKATSRKRSKRRNRKRPSPPPNPTSLACIPSGPLSNPLNIRPSSNSVAYNVSPQPLTANSSTQPTSKKRVVVGRGWPYARQSGGSNPGSVVKFAIPSTSKQPNTQGHAIITAATGTSSPQRSIVPSSGGNANAGMSPGSVNIASFSPSSSVVSASSNKQRYTPAIEAHADETIPTTHHILDQRNVSGLKSKPPEQLIRSSHTSLTTLTGTLSNTSKTSSPDSTSTLPILETIDHNQPPGTTILRTPHGVTPVTAQEFTRPITRQPMQRTDMSSSSLVDFNRHSNINGAVSHRVSLKPVRQANQHSSKGIKRGLSPDSWDLNHSQPRKRAFKWPTLDRIHSVNLKGEGNLGIRVIAFNSDGSQIALSCSDRTVRIWNNFNHTEIARLAHNYSVVSVAWMDDDTGIVSLADDGLVSKWTRTGQNHWQWTKVLDAGNDYRADDDYLCFAYTRDRIAVAFPRSGVKVWIWIKGTWQPQRSIIRQNVTSIKFVQDGEALLGGTRDGVLWYCQVPNGTLRAYTFLKSKVYSIDVNEPGGHALVAQMGGRSHLVGIRQDDKKGMVEQVYATKETEPQMKSEFGAIFTSHGQAVLFGIMESCVLVWDKNEGEIIYGLDHGEDIDIQAVANFNGAPSSKNGCLITGTKRGRLTWWSQPQLRKWNSSVGG